MHFATRHGWSLALSLGMLLANGLSPRAHAQYPPRINPQLQPTIQDENVRRAYDDGSSPTLLAPPPPITTSQPAPKPLPRRVLPVSFSHTPSGQKSGTSGSTASANETPTSIAANGNSAERSLALSPPSERSQNKANRPTSPTPKGSIATIFSSLAVVLGVFFLVVWFARKANPNATVTLPKDVVETLGRAPLGNRQYLHLVRVGHKLLLLSITPHGTETLTEIDEPSEVERLTSICQSLQPGSVTASFRQILSQLGNEPTTPGFLGNVDVDELAIANAEPSRRVRRRVVRDDDE